jgi:hypothetical protein
VNAECRLEPSCSSPFVERMRTAKSAGVSLRTVPSLSTYRVPSNEAIRSATHSASSARAGNQDTPNSAGSARTSAVGFLSIREGPSSAAAKLSAAETMSGWTGS